MFHYLKIYLQQTDSASKLAVFRFFFGLLTFIGVVRFWFKGWVSSVYVEPLFHFSYYGFEWIPPLKEYTYLLFAICAFSSILIMIGYKYSLSIIIFFLSFSFIELMDKTTYLNHYYFISVLSFIMIFLPANATFSIDSIINKKNYQFVPRWNIDCLKIMIGIVYVYAGIAKLNSDWLLNAQPLKIWLPSNYDIPILGSYFLQQEWVAYLMSWSGAIYDLSIPFLLMYKKTRFFAFVLVLCFHTLVKILFPIGMFPYIMVFVVIIFFDKDVNEKIINVITRILSFFKILFNHNLFFDLHSDSYKCKYFTFYIVSFFLIIQLLFPFRYLLYPGELFWHEQGYRFSWRVMLIEKKGISDFKIVYPNEETSFYVKNCDFLTPLQEKQMSFQPDFILEYAHFLGDHFSKKAGDSVSVFVDSYVSLNGRLSQRFVDHNVDLYREKLSLKNKEWILPLNDEIKGF